MPQGFGYSSRKRRINLARFITALGPVPVRLVEERIVSTTKVTSAIQYIRSLMKKPRYLRGPVLDTNNIVAY